MLTLSCLPQHLTSLPPLFGEVVGSSLARYPFFFLFFFFLVSFAKRDIIILVSYISFLVYETPIKINKLKKISVQGGKTNGEVLHT